jgi:formylglycine-generating enzyme required for sulfatase activity
MILIDGSFLVDKNGHADTDNVHLAQHQACSQWLTSDRALNGLCSRFDRDKWLAISSTLQRTNAHFCIDRYEFPNAYGEFPLVVSTFAESEAFCKKVGKRLCTENEWTYACEGEEGLPFPYGYDYNRSACNIDVFGPGPGEDTFKPRFTETTAKGIDLSWRGKRSGESPSCKSPFGVEDMTGNVDEWTRTVRKYGYQMIMKGGHWGPGRHRCRPQTRGHGPHYVRYDQGFRCCTDG